MNREELLVRQKALEAEFAAKRQETDELRAKIDKNENDLVLLQGRFAENSEMQAKLPAAEDEQLTEQPEKELSRGTRKK